ncbi:MAG: PKD domain-containing protein, partial [Acidimicrobiia bacterium]|nr:PKD domain-containing protein [Acidimicrobiia bacterium]
MTGRETTLRKAIRPLHTFELRLVSAILIGLLVLIGVSAGVSAQASGSDWHQTQAIEAAELGVSNPVGLVYSPESDTLFAFSSPGDGSAVTDFLRTNPVGDVLGVGSLMSGVPDPLNVAYYAPTESLFYLDRDAAEVAGVAVGPNGDRAPADQSTLRFDATAYGVSRARGVTFDATRRHLFVLEAAGPVPFLVRVTGDAQHSFDGEPARRDNRLERTRLTALTNVDVQGIAFNPQDEHLYVLGIDEKTLYELTTDGELVSTRDITSLGLQSPQSLVFAASADGTDDPANTSLFIADSGLAESTSTGDAAGGGQIVELSFQLAAAPTALQSASLVQIIDTSKAAWNPSSPDPAGIAYRPATAGLLISDSEVEENHPDFQGFNVFESTTSGTLFDTCATTDFSNEPTGAAVNPANGRIYFADDNANAVFEVDLGGDGTYCTADDVASSLSTSAFGSGDPEGLAIGNNKLFISDGVDREIYIVDLGADGVIGGTGPNADGLESQFDTFALGLRDPEGIEYNATSGTLFIVSTIGTDDFLVETTTDGTALNSFDLAFLGSLPRSGLAYGPGSQNPSVNTIYMASRGVDNGADPDENDGKVYEISIGSNPPPVPTADFVGSPLTGDAALTVSFTDQSTGSPTSWSWDFGDSNTSTQQSPTHTYTAAGTYTVTLTATNVSGSDSETKVDYVVVNAFVNDPPVAVDDSAAATANTAAVID